MVKRLASAALALYRREPARANQLAAIAASWLLLKVGLKVDSATVTLAVSGGLAYAAGELTRALVVPTATVDQVIADETADWQPSNPNVHRPKP